MRGRVKKKKKKNLLDHTPRSKSYLSDKFWVKLFKILLFYDNLCFLKKSDTAWTQVIQRRSASKFPHACSFMLFLHLCRFYRYWAISAYGEEWWAGERLRLLPFGAVPNPMAPLFPVAVCSSKLHQNFLSIWNDMYSPSQDKVYSVRVLHNTQRLGTHKPAASPSYF